MKKFFYISIFLALIIGTSFVKNTTKTLDKEIFEKRENITLLQEEGFGIPNIYSFNYKWDTEITWIGVMAQELLDTGYYCLLYNPNL